MAKNFIDEDCKKCAFYNPEEGPLYCDFTLDSTATPVRCTVLKKYVKKIKFMEKIV